MKKKSLLFLLYATLIIVSLALCLVFTVNKDNKSDTNNNLTTDKTYTTFTLSSDKDIYMHLSSEIEFTDDFFKVTNGDKSKITAQVLPYDNSNVEGLRYSNRKLVAFAVDSYKLEFELPISDTRTIKRSILIHVEDDPKVVQREEAIHVSKIYNLSELIDINNLTDYNIETDENLTLKNDTIEANNTGESLIKVYYFTNKVKIVYTIKLRINELPEYSILINDQDISTLEHNIEEEYFSFVYEIYDSTGINLLDQEISISIGNEQIVKLENITAPTVSLKIVGLGQTTLTITVEDFPEFIKIIEITIK